MAPLQKRAWIGLGVGVVISVAMLAVFVIKGVTAFHENLEMRVIVDILLVGGLIAWAVLLASTRAFPGWRIPGWAKVSCDERDETIIRRALSVQLLAVIFSLVAWAIALTEVYWEQGQIPIVYPYLIFFSTLIVNMMAQAIGILIGYRRMG